MVRLGGLIEQIRGVSYKPEDVYDKLDENSVILLRANNIKDGQLNFDDVVYVDKKRVRDNQLLKAGDVLICTSSGSKELVGKAAYVREDLPMTFGAFCKVVRPQKIHPNYLGHFFNSPNYRQKISDSSAGANINNIRNEHIDELEILLPTAERQKYIAIVLDKLTGLISLRKQQLAKLDELVKARFMEMFGDPEYNNRNLPIYKLSDLCEVGSSKRIYQNEQSSDGVPFLRVSDLVNRIDKGIESCELFIPSEKYKELCSQKLVPYQGDILVTSRGTLGKCYIVKDTDKFYFQDGMISWLSNFDKRITSVYISSLFSMSGFQKQITSLQSGSTIAYLSISMLKKLNIMLPTLQSQQQFVDFVEQVNLFGLTIQQSLDKLEVLRKSLMQEYFG
ncbi:MAG: restriction endonuclease subunit S [Dysosmobacter sp.]|uniref:restriction endonuclease subunit S n=1 Tax=uncultured Oscillibacter sp. TaxID=876091 RepID=UPI0026106440|nr:restriction endonuclease subunit S [uncultured Oscillibacter sp.]MCX4371055.1 restriction endonuclease subunit S [Dysosmobacter sp.]